MFGVILCVALFFWLLSTRKRLERAETRLLDEALARGKLEASLRALKQRFGELEARLEIESTPQPTAAGALASGQELDAGREASEREGDARPEPASDTEPREGGEAAPGDEARVDRGPAWHVAGVSAAQGAGGLDEPPADAQLAVPPARPQPPAADPVQVASQFLQDLLFGGNTVVRAGIVVLLVGVVLLLRWAAEHALFPIELRLVGVALLAIGFVVFGFRQRELKAGFGLTLQGGGIAALYLVVFFAFRSYALLPAPLAFALLIVISLCSGVLSVLQDSRSLIFIAQLFGFAAPLLASTGQGSHVALFSYYLLLNLLVFAVAFFKAWRALNLLGFVFTFGIATTWGVLSYEPRFFASTEPFLIAFFLLYLAIPVLYALRHAGTPRGWVDGSLVFGTPLAVLGLQWALVHERPFGMAYSVLALGAIYLGAATYIKRARSERFGALGEAFLPIGVGFATLAIPYGVDNHDLTAAAWAVEGAGLYWIGVRQTRVLARIAGVVLQLLAAGAVAQHSGRGLDALPVLNSWCIASVLQASAALFIARYAYARRSQLPEAEALGLQLLIVWGLAFWLRASFGEVHALAGSASQRGVQLFVLGGTALALETLGRKLAWPAGRVPGLLLWPSMWVYLSLYVWQDDTHPLARTGWLGWPMIALGMYFVLRHFVEEHLGQLRSLHALSVWSWTWWSVVLITHVGANTLDDSFRAGLANALIGAVMLVVLRLARGPSWPFGAHKQHTLLVTLLGLALYGGMRGLLCSATLPGSSAPLPYVPIVNTLDLSALLGLIALIAWLRRLGEEGLANADQRFIGYGLVTALAFAWWNALLARSVHHYAGVPFDYDALFASSALQLAFSLSWTLIALSAMVIAHRTQARAPWLGAAALLAVVVAKLFLLDLEHLSTPTKIVSFLGVGALLLLVGYIAPVPPKAATRASESPP